MKIRFISFKSSSESWLYEAVTLYTKKINHMISCEWIELKAPKLSRAQAEEKKSQEAEILKKQLNPKARLIVFDEKGELKKDSVDFAKDLQKHLEGGAVQLDFVVGGAYGVGEEIKSQAKAVYSLSPLTMNHHVALVTAMEQVYRALTIWKGLPYHNQ